MRSRALRDLIPCFDDEADASAPEGVDAPDAAALSAPSFPALTPREPPPDLDAAFERGRQAGLEEARAASEAQLASLRQEATLALEQARLAWAGEMADALQAALQEGLQALETRLADAAGRLLRPFLAQALCDAASRALIEQIRPLLSGADGGMIEVSGPAYLLQALRRVFAPGAAVTFVESASADIRIVAGDALIETRIAAWVDRLDGLGPDPRRAAH